MLKNIYIFFLFAAGGFIALAPSGGVGAVQGKDRTGSPLTEGSCQTCHNNGSFNPSAAIEILQNDAAVTQYVPGETYTVRIITTAGAGTPAEYGFQAVALQGADEDAGSFTAGAGMQISAVNGRSYAEHSSPSGDNVFTLTWTAPAAGAGNVNFYASTTAVNGMNGSSGDNGAVAPTVMLTEDMSSSVAETGIGKMQMSITPNPVGEMLNYTIVGRDNGNYDLRLVNAFGKVITAEKVNLRTGENILNLDVSALSKGIYILQISSKNYYAAERMLKL